MNDAIDYDASRTSVVSTVLQCVVVFHGQSSSSLAPSKSVVCVWPSLRLVEFHRLARHDARSDRQTQLHLYDSRRPKIDRRAEIQPPIKDPHYSNSPVPPVTLKSWPRITGTAIESRYQDPRITNFSESSRLSIYSRHLPCSDGCGSPRRKTGSPALDTEYLSIAKKGRITYHESSHESRPANPCYS